MATWGDAFSQSFQSASQLAMEVAYKKWKDKRDSEEAKGKVAADMYAKTLPTTYMTTDPTTGKTVTYSIQSDVPDDMRATAEAEFRKYLGIDSGSPQVPRGGIFGQQASMPGMAPSVGGINPPGVSVVRQGGKTSFVKNAGTKDSPAVAAEKELTGTGQFLKQFGRSYEELKTKYPEIGDVGFTGWATRKGASIDNAIDGLPETKAFQVELLPLANQMARDVEGGRVTDKDREVYANSFANTLQHPTETNVRLVANSLIKLKNKGGDITKVLSELGSSDVDVMQKIVNEVIKDAPGLKQQVMMQIYQNNPGRFEVVNE